jgi:hypothetical protein
MAARVVQVEVLNGSPTFVPLVGNVQGVTFKKVLPSPMLPGSFASPNCHWYPDVNGIYVVVRWTTPSGQPVVSKAAISVSVELA